MGDKRELKMKRVQTKERHISIILNVNKTSAIIATFVISIVASLSPASASVKAGSACPKTGQISQIGTKRFTCLKVGKKLLWDKGIDVSKANTVFAQPAMNVDPTAPANVKLTDNGRVISLSWSAPTQQNNLIEYYRIHGDCVQAGSPCGSYEHDVWAKNSSGSILTSFDINKSDISKTNSQSTWKFGVSAGNQSLNTQSPITNFPPVTLLASSEPPASHIYPVGSGNPNPPIYPENAGSRSIQKLIDDLDLGKSTNHSQVNVVIEPGKNGPYADIGIKGVQFALKFYSALGMNVPHSVVNLILARTHSWGLQQIKSLIPNCNIEDGPVLDGGVTLCSSSTNGTIFTNLVQGTAHDPNIDPNVDLNSVIETSDWLADFAHETMHVYQGSQDSFNNLPNWMSEGAAQFFGYLAAAKYSNGAITYNQEVEKYLDWRHDVQGMCSTPAAQMQSPCEYTQGLFVIEYLVQKYGIKGYNDLIFNSGSGNFDSRLQNALGISQNQFFSDVDKYLKERGWEK